MASNPNASVLEDAAGQGATFFTLWIGSNDILSFATSGGAGVDHNTTGNLDPSTYGGNDITNANTFAVQELRNQLDTHVHPIHRLDRKTSGVLVLAKQKEHVAVFEGVSKQGAKYFRGRKPQEVVYTEQFHSRSEASKREYAIKKMSAAAKRKLIC